METSNAKKLKKYALPAALLAGGLTAGSIFSPIGFASAQEADEESEPTTTESDSEPSDSNSDSESGSDDESGNNRGRKGSRGAKGELAAETLGLTTDELRAGLAEGKSLAQLAEESDIAVEDLKAALIAGLSERIDEALANDRIDAEEAAAKKAEIEDRVDQLIEATYDERSDDGERTSRRGQRGQGLEGVSEALGLTTDEVREGLQAGQSLADLAAEQGVSEDDIVAALMEGIQERIDQAIESGKIDAEDAAERVEAAEEKVQDFVNGEQTERSEGSQRGRSGKRGHSDRGASESDRGSTEETVQA